MRSVLLVALFALAVSAARCGKGVNSCSSYGKNYCCSKYGYCGTTTAYCGPASYQCQCDCNGSKPCIGGSSSTPATPIATCRVTASALNVRSGPSTSYKIVKTLQNGASVSVYSKSGDWSKISASSKEYVSSKYLNCGGSTTPDTPVTPEPKGSYIRGPTPDSKYVGTCKGPNFPDTNKQTRFIKQILVGAQKGEWKYGVLTSLTLAQAILESGWGGSPICNNIFGIKATASETKKCLVSTKEEYVQGQLTTIKAYFKAYDSFDDSVMDHAVFLQKPRYSKVVGEKNYKTACTEIKNAGYATSSTYTQKLIKLVESYGLWQYDGCCDYITNPNCKNPRGW